VKEPQFPIHASGYSCGARALHSVGKFLLVLFDESHDLVGNSPVDATDVPIENTSDM
jgi:hypothetical protein